MTRHLQSALAGGELEKAVVRFIQDLRYEDIDATARAGVGRLVRDQLALQVGAARLPWSVQLLDYAGGHARPGVARVAGTALTMAAGDAAFVNSSFGHGFEYDDLHAGSWSHPGCCVAAAAFAIAEELDASLEDVITALVAGYEVYTRIGILAAPDLILRGFHPHAVLSVFGAAAVAAKLRRLDDETTLHALAIALSHAAGTTEYTSSGGSIKRIHAGIGTRNGMVAADMAMAGVTGPRAFLTGRKGFYQTFLGRGPGEAAASIFDRGRPLEVGSVMLKAYCACYCAHAYVDALRPFAPRLAEIEKVDLRLKPACDVLVGTPNANAYAPRNIEHVQFSLPVQAAFALRGLGNGFRVHRDYVDGRIDMGPVIATARLVTMAASPELERRFPGQFVADATITFRDGPTEQVLVENPTGSLANPMTEAEQDAKFLDLTAEILGETRARDWLAMLRRMDGRQKAREVMAMTIA